MSKLTDQTNLKMSKSSEIKTETKTCNFCDKEFEAEMMPMAFGVPAIWFPYCTDACQAQLIEETQKAKALRDNRFYEQSTSQKGLPKQVLHV